MSVTKEHILSTVCDVMGVSEADIRGPQQTKPICRARYMAMYLLSDLCSVSSVFAGIFFRKNRTSVSHAKAKAERFLERDEAFREEHRRILCRLAEVGSKMVVAA